MIGKYGRYGLGILALGFIFWFAPATGHALESQYAQYVLDASDGLYLTDEKWCATTTADKPWDYSLANCNTGAGTISGFDATTFSYVMFKNHQPDPPMTHSCNGNASDPYRTNRYTLFVAPAGHKIKLYKGTDALGTQQYYLTTTTGQAYYKAVIRAEPNTDPAYKCNWTGSFSTQQYSVESLTTTSVTSTHRGAIIGNDVYEGQVGAVNVEYSASWDSGKFTDGVPHGEVGEESCDTLDIGCWVRSITRGFTNGIKELVGMFVDLWKWLFVPDGEAISNAFQDLADSFLDTLGFLAFPFTFLADLINAVGTSSSSCSSGSCVLSTGNVFGSGFNIDIGKFEDTFPTVWAFMMAGLRGVTVLLLIAGLHQKYREVTA